MILSVLNGLIIGTIFTIIIRLITFDQKGKRYKPIYGLIALLLINAGIYLGVGLIKHAMQSVLIAWVLALLMQLLNIYCWYHKGNIARMLVSLWFIYGRLRKCLQKTIKSVTGTI